MTKIWDMLVPVPVGRLALPRLLVGLKYIHGNNRTYNRNSRAHYRNNRTCRTTTRNQTTPTRPPIQRRTPNLNRIPTSRTTHPTLNRPGTARRHTRSHPPQRIRNPPRSQNFTGLGKRRPLGPLPRDSSSSWRNTRSEASRNTV